MSSDGNRIDGVFDDLRRRGDKALMPYLTVGDPDLAGTEAILDVMQSSGAAIVELGVPFSDPIADGRVIEASMHHALQHGLRVDDVLKLVASGRDRWTMGLAAMLSFSIVHRRGPEAFAAAAAEAGVDGLIVPDLPVEEAQRVSEAVGKSGLRCSFLIAPSTPIDRAKRIAEASTGFVYLVARAGITGESERIADDLADRVEQLRGVTDLPIAVGFGVSNADHVRAVVACADAVIIGSAIMRRVAEHRDQGAEAVARNVESFMNELRGGLAP